MIKMLILIMDAKMILAQLKMQARDNMLIIALLGVKPIPKNLWCIWLISGWKIFFPVRRRYRTTRTTSSIGTNKVENATIIAPWV